MFHFGLKQTFKAELTRFVFVLKYSKRIWKYQSIEVRTKLEGVGKSCPHKQPQKKLMGQSKEIKQNWTGLRNCNICFCVIFSFCDKSLFSGSETRH